MKREAVLKIPHEFMCNDSGFTDLTEKLRDDVALTVFRQIVKDVGMRDLVGYRNDELLEADAEYISKVAYGFADIFLKVRHETRSYKINPDVFKGQSHDSNIS